ncbi:hemolysin family protein [Zoogloea dura]|uniref:Polyamine export protein n=1 Tax=Zoogloea dura TaxID=2728840 RepID=A0A848G321_9RHOO|nr:hemolysin family protein [Zoogloea dura]NML24843.1 HlyC/CorC family transporter [Zoogloea dura]
MGFTQQILLIVLLVGISAFFSVSEISVAASRKSRLAVLAESGDEGAARVLALQARPGPFFTLVQIGLNGVAIMGGIVGEGAFSPWLTEFLGPMLPEAYLDSVAFTLSFVLVTSLFILFADLMPKRLSMASPERLASAIAGPMILLIRWLQPLLWLYNGAADLLFRLLGVPTARNDTVTPDEIIAVVEAGAQAGVLAEQEHAMIENVFGLEVRSAPSAMTLRESVVFFTLEESEESIRQKITSRPFNRFPVCDGSIDHVVGYVDAKDLLNRVLAGQSLSMKADAPINPLLALPDSLTLSEVLERLREARDDFAVIINEYALVVGVITLNDIIRALVGDDVEQVQEEQILRRDDNSWLVDGATAAADLMRVLDIDDGGGSEHYETVAGFMMYHLRKIPRRTDRVDFAGYRFEVLDVDNHRIDQLLVSRLDGATGEISGEG